MNRTIEQRQEEILKKYPAVKGVFKKMCATRRDEITNMMLESDAKYQGLTHCRAEASRALLDVLTRHSEADKLEAYSDAIYAEEVYELNAVYREAFLDAIEAMEMVGMI